MRALVHLVAISFAFGGMASATMAQQSVTLTTTSDFRKGNNEGLISTAQDRLTRDRIAAGTVGTWTTTAALPAARHWTGALAHNGFAYLIGGFDPTFAAINEVLYAPINANGTLGTWTATTALPSARGLQTSVAYNGFVYSIGGSPDGSFGLVDVLVAPINANGTLGAWSATTSLPTQRSAHSTVVYNGYLYTFGGSPDAQVALSEVLYAPIQADGSVGAWSTTTALPTGRQGLSCVAYNGFVYAMGGDNGSFNFMSDVLVAPINANGTLGSWTATTALPAGRYFLSSVAHNGFVYVIGGWDASLAMSGEVFAAPINSNGTVGTWSATTALPSGRLAHATMVYGDNVYSIGGLATGFAGTGEVVVSPFNPDALNANQSPDRLRGYYSHLVDLQSDTNTRYVLLNGQASSGGAVRLQVRVAPDGTDVFGAETVVATVNLGTAVQVPGNGRYVWIRVTLDDTATSNPGQPTFISDITVSPTDPTPPPPPPPPPPSPPPVISPPPARSNVVDPRDDDILPCAAGTSATPIGLLALAGLILLAAAARRR